MNYIFIIIFVVFYLFYKLVFSIQNKKYPNISDKNILLAVRSYNRPEYLSKTINYLKKSDIFNCKERIIYDDHSTDKNTLNILKDSSKINNDKLFDIIYNEENRGVDISYHDLLKYIKKNYTNKISHIIIMDNDVEVKPNFVSQLQNIWNEAAEELKTNKFILSGYKSTASQHVDPNQIEYKNFIKKDSTGAVCYFFHIELLPFMIEIYEKEAIDWAITNKIRDTPGYHFCVVKEGLVNHFGEFGSNNNGGDYDRDVNFK